MHTIHYLAVKADSPQAAREAATAWLESDSSSPMWWDWFEIGGRWSDALTDAAFLGIDPDEVDATEGDCAPLSCRSARAALRQVVSWQDAQWAQCRDDILGLHPVNADGKRPSFGPALAPAAAAALMAPTIAEAQSNGFSDASMWFWRVEQARSLMDGQWCSESHFLLAHPEAYDRLGCPRDLLARLDAGADELADWFLLVVDFHY